MKSHLTDIEFENISRLAYDRTGIILSNTKRDMIISRLTKRLRVLNISSFDEYCKILETERFPSEDEEFISAITTNVTRTMREPHHFEDLITRIIPRLSHLTASGGKIRIWSAGCSTGEEPASILMTFIKRFPGFIEKDFRILATDIDNRVLNQVHSRNFEELLLDFANFFPIYKDDAVCFEKYFRKIVVFRHHNLMKHWPMKGPFDVVFCRNVLIYFDDKTQHEILGKFYHVMKPGSTLFLGHSERVGDSLSKKFVRSGLTTYQRI